uniref:Tc1-like transposase DDE domain-containing protein n=1 Tax=Plectus sambesii TaxID=2011161 RepID=A0A914X175_9BILA
MRVRQETSSPLTDEKAPSSSAPAEATTEKLTAEILERIKEAVERCPVATLKQINQRLEEDQIVLSKSTIFNGLVKLKITLKKCHHELDRVNSAATIASRQAYALDFSTHALENKAKCIFIDESSFNLHLQRTKAHSRRGTRTNIILPTVRGRMVTLIAAMSNKGIVHTKIINDGTCNGVKFCVFVCELIARLREREEMNGAWLILDNAHIHKTCKLQEILAGSPYEIKFLLPHSYILNLAENVFSKVKASAKRILSGLVGEQTLSGVTQESVGTVSQQDCANYVINMLSKLTMAVAGQPYVN